MLCSKNSRAISRATRQKAEQLYQLLYQLLTNSLSIFYQFYIIFAQELYSGFTHPNNNSSPILPQLTYSILPQFYLNS